MQGCRMPADVGGIGNEGAIVSGPIRWSSSWVTPIRVK